MAKQLDLQEQEQLDELKAFWKQYGNLITGVLTLAMLAFAAWNGWNWYQREQGKKAGALYEALEQAVASGDAARGGQAFNDLKERYPRTAFAQQGGLLAAKLLSEKGQADPARAALAWVAEHASEDEYRTIARLRLAGVLFESKQYDEALKQLAGASAPEFAALVADRRGDVLLAQGKKDEAKAAYQAAYKAMDEKLDYRRLVDAKLTALGAAPAASAAASGAAR
ncbi:tetratricopeptide repeat protein [Aquincola sp. S2]|uniref:Ancillary SecYEG translocon subunit n=1 Tax=Pseudaquabacterium terrae TaxID=2732868 RepID=A0ABX2EJ17_9BURK|nr:tetratricopeptide repeat protein [Aquabacterium terrae]NRF68603.1 tetratricopeptide repeat protein [Aquabacterium terrae]